MSSRRDRLVLGITTNVAAAASGAGVAVFSGLPILARIPAAMVAGTVGYLVGSWLAGVGLRVLRRVRLARPGHLVYDLGRLPQAEAVRAGGKASALARLIQAGFRVPAGLVILSSAFEGDALRERASTELRSHRLGGDRFAVRSSALAEDSAYASFAGSFETVLDVPAEGIEEAVLRVRRSGAAERVSAYSAAHGIDVSHEVAVVVQRMLAPELAGVLFTVHPLTGDLGTMLGNVVAGLGEAVVSGDADAAEFTCHRPDGAYAGPVALASNARELHGSAHDIEGLFGGVPQDIEWAVEGGRVWILQSRPVTTLSGWNPVTAERNDSLTGTCLWSATNLTEANPEPQTPLTVSWARYLQDHGGPTMKLHGREMAGCIGGRPYANLTVQLSVRGPKVAADPRAAYRQIAGLWGELPDDVPIPLIPLTRADWQEEGLTLLGTLVKLRRARAGLGRFLATSRNDCRALTARVDAAGSPAALLALWERGVLPACLRSFWAVIAATDDRVDGLEAELRDLVGAEDATALLGSISSLTGGLESLGPVLGLQEVRTGHLSPADYLERFGHRGYNEIELAWPRPVEDPHWLDRALAADAQGADAAGMRDGRQAECEAALTRLRTGHPGAARGLEQRLRRRAQAAARREVVRSESVRWTGVGRRFALRAGQLLGIGEDVFLLTLPELVAALGGDTASFARFDSRRNALQRSRALPSLPGFVVGAFDPFAWAADPGRRTDIFVAGQDLPPATLASADQVTGAAGSLGVVEGRVRRLDRLEDADQLLPGEVLVTHLTNIGWTPIFPRAAAIVTDLGAPLSHAAIVARELGLPAVVGCGDATARLATGDLVRVDGRHGTVDVLARGTVPDTLEHVFDSTPSPG